eukprot:TRINITY_DN1912_c0_g1_i1.p1 TRINITY_DN1912_c0_g1~~TRINITY_DN1912_c0_g1_i1.p1  ORF type:complete len:347 (-),score=73.02 TRINITY_DN1912_c0_g1_i1:78-1118(-)
MDVEQSIHCKVTFKDQFRRFLFVGKDFVSLKNQIRSVLGIEEQQEFILKYKDNEGDLITISSDEELNCGRSFSQDLLRLTVVLPNTDSNKQSDVPSADQSTLPWRAHGGRGRGRGRCRGRIDMDLEHGHPYRPGCHGRRWSEYGYEMMKAGLIAKRDYIKTQVDQLTRPEEASLRAHLQSKLDRIESRLENMSTDTPDKDKMYKKWHKKERKKGKYSYKGGAGGEDVSASVVSGVDDRAAGEFECTYYNEKRHLSEETLALIATLRLTLVPFKLTLKTTKNELKLRKHMLKEAKHKGKDSDVQQLVKEIENLKNLKNETKINMEPIKQQIRQLKEGTPTTGEQTNK